MRPAHFRLSGHGTRPLRLVQVHEVAGGPRKNKPAAMQEGLVSGVAPDGRFHTKGKGGTVEGEYWPSWCFEASVGAHFTPLGNGASVPCKGRTPSKPAPPPPSVPAMV